MPNCYQGSRRGWEKRAGVEGHSTSEKYVKNDMLIQMFSHILSLLIFLLVFNYLLHKVHKRAVCLSWRKRRVIT